MISVCRQAEGCYFTISNACCREWFWCFDWESTCEHRRSCSPISSWLINKDTMSRLLGRRKEDRVPGLHRQASRCIRRGRFSPCFGGRKGDRPHWDLRLSSHRPFPQAEVRNASKAEGGFGLLEQGEGNWAIKVEGRFMVLSYGKGIVAAGDLKRSAIEP